MLVRGRRRLSLERLEERCTPTTTTWSGGTDTDWHNANNWTNGVPSSTVDAVIAVGTYVPTISSTAAAKSITGGNDMIINAQLTVTDMTWTYRNGIHGSGSLVVDSGTLTLTGATNNSNAYSLLHGLDVYVQNGGTMKVQKDVSNLKVDQLVVGYSSAGTLEWGGRGNDALNGNVETYDIVITVGSSGTMKFLNDSAIGTTGGINYTYSPSIYNYGTVLFSLTPNAPTTFLNVGARFYNHGIVNLGDGNGKARVDFNWAWNKFTSDPSFVQTTGELNFAIAGSHVQGSNGIVINGGVLDVKAASPQIDDKLTLDGGIIQFGDTSYQTLTLYDFTFLSGEIKISVDATTSDVCDKINVTNVYTSGSGSSKTLSITKDGVAGNNKTWDVLVCDTRGGTAHDFNTVNGWIHDKAWVNSNKTYRLSTDEDASDDEEELPGDG